MGSPTLNVGSTFFGLVSWASYKGKRWPNVPIHLSVLNCRHNMTGQHLLPWLDCHTGLYCGTVNLNQSFLLKTLLWGVFVTPIRQVTQPPPHSVMSLVASKRALSWVKITHFRSGKGIISIKLSKHSLDDLSVVGSKIYTSRSQRILYSLFLTTIIHHRHSCLEKSVAFSWFCANVFCFFFIISSGQTHLPFFSAVCSVNVQCCSFGSTNRTFLLKIWIHITKSPKGEEHSKQTVLNCLACSSVFISGRLQIGWCTLIQCRGTEDTEW